MDGVLSMHISNLTWMEASQSPTEIVGVLQYFERGLFSCLYKVVGVKHSNEAKISVIQEALRIFYHFS